MAVRDHLLANEQVVFESRKHWIAPVRDSWTAALLLLAALVVNRISPDDANGIVGSIEWLLGWIVIGLVVVGIAMIAYNIAAWRTAEFAITNQRVAREEGLISRRSSATVLGAITDVQTRIPFLGSRLGYGDVLVMAQSGEAGADKMLSITQPAEFRQQILAQMSQKTSPTAAPSPAPAPASSPTAPDDVATLERLAALRDSGAISAEEYEAKKAEILSRL
jgi:uncharacterized membrane protein YdbT with pleckstrin-like domain